MCDLYRVFITKKILHIGSPKGDPKRILWGLGDPKQKKRGVGGLRGFEKALRVFEGLWEKEFFSLAVTWVGPLSVKSLLCDMSIA